MFGFLLAEKHPGDGVVPLPKALDILGHEKLLAEFKAGRLPIYVGNPQIGVFYEILLRYCRPDTFPEPHTFDPNAAAVSLVKTLAFYAGNWWLYMDGDKYYPNKSRPDEPLVEIEQIAKLDREMSGHYLFAKMSDKDTDNVPTSSMSFVDALGREIKKLPENSTAMRPILMVCLDKFSTGDTPENGSQLRKIVEQARPKDNDHNDKTYVRAINILRKIKAAIAQ